MKEMIHMLVILIQINLTYLTGKWFPSFHYQDKNLKKNSGQDLIAINLAYPECHYNRKVKMSNESDILPTCKDKLFSSFYLTGFKIIRKR
jgi:hypothetical protein